MRSLIHYGSSNSPEHRLQTLSVAPLQDLLLDSAAHAVWTLTDLPQFGRAAHCARPGVPHMECALLEQDDVRRPLRSEGARRADPSLPLRPTQTKQTSPGHVSHTFFASIHSVHYSPLIRGFIVLLFSRSSFKAISDLPPPSSPGIPQC